MKIFLRITRKLLEEIHTDLSRPHPYAFERVAFVSCTVAEQGHGDLLLLASTLHPIADLDYEVDFTAGAMLGAGAFRKALQYSFSHSVAMFHIHRHEHVGQPAFSSFDIRESACFVPDFWNVQPKFPHGTLLLSHDSMSGLIWLPETQKATSMSGFSIIGNPVREVEHGNR